MTALDQAFIKAFSQQGAPAAAIPLRPTTPTIPTAKQPPTPSSDTFDGVLAALEKPPSRLPKAEGGGRRAETRAEEHVTPPDCGPGGREPGPGNLPPLEVGSEQWAVTSGQWAVDGGQWAIGSKPWATDSVQCASDDAGQSAVNNEPHAPTSGMTDGQPASIHIPQSIVQDPQSTIPHPSSLDSHRFADAPPPPPAFKPAWQVERFTWPRVCRRLIGRAADELDRLADALLTANAGGQKVLAVAGYRQGEGATTLLLCAARRLAERGVKAVLVDADRARPRLAKRLGVQPQSGWNDVSADEGRSLDQAVVEATANNLALVPLAGPSAGPESAAGDWSRFAPCIETLRKHYEMVLVDPGPLEDLGPVGDALARTAGGKVDALLLVCNQRITPEEDLSEVQERLSAAGIAVTGLIENFVVA